MTEDKIERLQELVSHYVGPDKIITNVKIQPLTAPGENYFSTMLDVKLTLKNEKNGTEEPFNAVAKCVITHGQEMRGSMTMTFTNEIAFYDEIVPAVEKFLQDEGGRGIKDVIPEVYAVRSNLHGNGKEIDKDAVILLENLKLSGYSNTDRNIGFDLEGAQIILKDLAYFHSSFLALKLKKPDIFKDKILSNIRTPGPPAKGSPDGKSPQGLPQRDPLKGPPPPGVPQGGPSVIGIPNAVLSVIEEQEHLKKYIEKIKELKLFVFGTNDDSDNPFNTLSHNDMWTNNTMQTFRNGKIEKNKFVDFQMYSYDSLAKDVLFFIWSSVQADIVDIIFDDLLKVYHENLVNNLKDLHCDVSPFTYENFMKEIDVAGKMKLGQLLVMTFVIFGKKGVALVDTSKGAPGPDMFKPEALTDIAKARMIKLVDFFVSKGWL